MTTEYPYVLTPDAFREFVGKLRSVGVPGKVDKKYVESLGYKSSNHRKFPAPLKFVGLIDGSGNPTDKYRNAIRDPEKGPAQLAEYIREAYLDLFDVYPDAYRKDDEALRNFFAAHTDLGERAVNAVIDTFQALCSFADFTGAKSEPPRDGTRKQEREKPSKGQVEAGSGPSGVVINVNLQLELPDLRRRRVRRFVRRFGKASDA